MLKRILFVPIALFAAGGVWLPRGNAEAGTVIAMNIEQMTDRANLIFTGEVVGQRAEWNAERTRIYTYVTFQVDRYLKGGSSAEIATVRLLGGQVGPYRAVVPGMPQFVNGEDVLLFCAGEGVRVPTVVGLSLGKFTIVTDAEGERIVKRDISTLMIADHNTAARKPGDPITRYRLEHLESRIREHQR